MTFGSWLALQSNQIAGLRYTASDTVDDVRERLMSKPVSAKKGYAFDVAVIEYRAQTSAHAAKVAQLLGR
jgi:hypothetical protein